MSIAKILLENAEANVDAKYRIIDETLFKLLRVHGVTNSTNIDQIRKALKKHNFEIVLKQTHNVSGDIYEFNLCRVFAKETVKILKPQL